MKKEKLLFAIGAAILITGCTPKTEIAEPTAATEAEIMTEAETTAEVETARQEEGGTLKEVADLLGMMDGETESMLGGGEENWTEDRSVYIGRIFQAEVYGETYPVYTSCSREGAVESVSMKIVNGERPVEETEIQEWTDRITEYTGVIPAEEQKFSEGGSRQKSWRSNGRIVTMYYMKDNLSISFQELVGELE